MAENGTNSTKKNSQLKIEQLYLDKFMVSVSMNADKTITILMGSAPFKLGMSQNIFVIGFASLVMSSTFTNVSNVGMFQERGFVLKDLPMV